MGGYGGDCPSIYSPLTRSMPLLFRSRPGRDSPPPPPPLIAYGTGIEFTTAPTLESSATTATDACCDQFRNRHHHRHHHHHLLPYFLLRHRRRHLQRSLLAWWARRSPLLSDSTSLIRTVPRPLLSPLCPSSSPQTTIAIVSLSLCATSLLRQRRRQPSFDCSTARRNLGRRCTRGSQLPSYPGLPHIHRIQPPSAKSILRTGQANAR